MGNFNLYWIPNIIQGSLVITVVVLSWFAWDMRSILKAGQRKNQLSIEGRWKDLEAFYEQSAKPHRPFVWLYRNYLLPGGVAVQHGLFLFKQGRLEEALVKVDLGIRQIEGKPLIFRPCYRSVTFKTRGHALNARLLILTGLGRYDEARAVAAQWLQLKGGNDCPNAPLALLEYKCGNLDEALTQAQAVPPGDSQYDTMRSVTALVHSAKGEFDEAIQALGYEPSDIKVFYSPAGFKTMHESPEGVKLVELQRRKHAGVFQPARLLRLAIVYLAKEEYENAQRVLDQAEKLLGPEPAIQSTYCQARACSLAALGKAAEAEAYIERMRAIVQQTPKRGLIYETHYATGRSYLFLGRPGDALVELMAAQGFVLHPVEKHFTNYWIARALEAAGDPQRAVPYYQIVAADPIASWMRKGAAEALRRIRG